jgi:hypothetical protein
MQIFGKMRPPMSTISAVHLALRISPRMFDKIWNHLNVIIRALGEDDSWKIMNIKNLLTLSSLSSLNQIKFLIDLGSGFNATCGNHIGICNRENKYDIKLGSVQNWTVSIIGFQQCESKLYRKRNRGTCSIQLNFLIYHLTVSKGALTPGLLNRYTFHAGQNLPQVFATN